MGHPAKLHPAQLRVERGSRTSSEMHHHDRSKILVRRDGHVLCPRPPLKTSNTEAEGDLHQRHASEFLAKPGSSTNLNDPNLVCVEGLNRHHNLHGVS